MDKICSTVISFSCCCLPLANNNHNDNYHNDCRVYSRYPNLLAEMYAYSMAAAHEELPHFTVLHHMVSNTHMAEEGWKWVDVLNDDVCVPPDASTGLYYSDKPMPTFLHYCQFFRSGEFGFQKRRIRKSIFDCNSPMMAELPSKLGTSEYKNRDGEVNCSRFSSLSILICAVARAVYSC